MMADRDLDPALAFSVLFLELYRTESPDEIERIIDQIDTTVADLARTPIRDALDAARRIRIGLERASVQFSDRTAHGRLIGQSLRWLEDEFDGS